MCQFNPLPETNLYIGKVHNVKDKAIYAYESQYNLDIMHPKSTYDRGWVWKIKKTNTHTHTTKTSSAQL